MTTLATRLRIEEWTESPVEDLDDGGRTTHAHVLLRDGGDGLSSGTAEMLAFYRPDGTSAYVTLLRLSGELDGRSGSFVLRGDGHYDGATATGRMEIVPGSGTGGLAGIAGSCASESTHADYPFMPLVLDYRLD